MVVSITMALLPIVDVQYRALVGRFFIVDAVVVASSSLEFVDMGLVRSIDAVPACLPACGGWYSFFLFFPFDS